MTRDVFQTDKAPGAQGPYSQAIGTDSLIFLAGQGGLDPATGAVVEGGVEAEAERTLKNIAIVLEEAGASMADLVKATCFLADMADFAAFNAVYERFVPEPRPARTTVAAKELPLGLRVEIEVIAQRP